MIVKFSGDIYWYRLQSAADRACGAPNKLVTMPPTITEIDRILTRLSKADQSAKTIDVENQLLEMRQTLTTV